MHARFPFVGGCLAIFCILLPITQASADPIFVEETVRVTWGNLFVTSQGNSSLVGIEGTRGFSLFGVATGRTGMPMGWCAPCEPGEISITGNYGSYTGTATLRDEVYPLGPPSGQAFIGFSTAAFVLPPVPSAVPLTVPFAVSFTASGYAKGYDPEDPWINFTGAGTAYISFIANRQDVGDRVLEFYSATDLRLEFEGRNAPPVPEPASLLLLGTGLAVAWFRRRQTTSV